MQNILVKSSYWLGKNKRKQYIFKRLSFNNIINFRLQLFVLEEEEEEEEEEEVDEDYELELVVKRFKFDFCGKFLRRSLGEVKNLVQQDVCCYMIVIFVVKQCMYKLVYVFSIFGSINKIFRVLFWEVFYSDQFVNLFIG